ncbi:hypothetical protein CERSUDRAFT_80629 [Gelatoporia subvermispora B]|uniref:Heterokaryon incompatibility domain-containing protein n=1 Tax=Ceriporiopsis subvermispora (strain B) TaxID=914234 RepID=M2QV67_CERS8|nr:hypothetical protein CERSUDRAFT_80629 [Gelatoporia subvermispora B]
MGQSNTRVAATGKQETLNPSAQVLQTSNPNRAPPPIRNSSLRSSSPPLSDIRPGSQVHGDFPALSRELSLGLEARLLLDVIEQQLSSVINSGSESLPQVNPVHLPSSQPSSSTSNAQTLQEVSESHGVDAVLMCKDALWLGAKHDGYPMVPFLAYKMCREPSARLHEDRMQHGVLYAALEQSHHTFGLLETLLGHHIPERRLLRRLPCGKVVITTEEIVPILQECSVHARSLMNNDSDKFRQWCSLARQALEGTGRFIAWGGSQCKPTFANVNADARDIDKLVYLIAAIMEASWTFLNKELQSAGVDILPPLTSDSGLCKGCVTEMVEDGWCPFTVGQLWGFGLCALGFASTRRPFVRKGVGHRDHSQCTKKLCVFNNINPALYSNVHVTERCMCTFVTPPVKLIKDALHRGEIPIISIHASSDPDDAKLKMICSTASSVQPYIAISHVWADGLGSTTGRGLPECQLRHLSQLAHQLVDGGYLWLDALCVPEEKEYRSLAIGLMGQTYRKAAKVLVIDSGIGSCSIRASGEERLLRVATSGWMQRLWTLQEAVLAPQLIFQFSDGLLAFLDLLQPGMDFTLPVATELICAFGDMVILLTTPSWRSSYVRLRAVTNALCGRLTSKLSDETLAISSLLGIDSYALASTDSMSERMKMLLLQHGEIPADMPFINRGSRLTEPGFRWAPATFLREGSATRAAECGGVLCTPQGLLAKYYCFALRTPLILYNDKVLLSRLTSNLVLYYGKINDPREQLSGNDYCNAILLTAEPSLDDHAAAVWIEEGFIYDRRGIARRRCTYIKPIQILAGMFGVPEDPLLREPVDVEEGRFVHVCLT